MKVTAFCGATAWVAYNTDFQQCFLIERTGTPGVLFFYFCYLISLDFQSSHTVPLNLLAIGCH